MRWRVGLSGNRSRSRDHGRISRPAGGFYARIAVSRWVACAKPFHAPTAFQSNAGGGSARVQGLGPGDTVRATDTPQPRPATFGPAGRADPGRGARIHIDGGNPWLALIESAARFTAGPAANPLGRPPGFPVAPCGLDVRVQTRYSPNLAARGVEICVGWKRGSVKAHAPKFPGRR